MTTRVGDISCCWASPFCTLSRHAQLRDILHDPAVLMKLATTPSVIAGLMVSVGLLLFAGTVGKSAQFPLHVWLPDAMEGPTPVSAMIHAATMVSAGVYMVIRIYPLFTADFDGQTLTTTMSIIAFIGAFTALFAATIALAQNDIKKVLAYSHLAAGLHDRLAGHRGLYRRRVPSGDACLL
jgi:NADH-quinone oxidoreductase subunit L